MVEDSTVVAEVNLVRVVILQNLAFAVVFVLLAAVAAIRH